MRLGGTASRVFASLGPLLALGACTTLGPMPAITMADPIPDDRVSGEIQWGIVPGPHLSRTVEADLSASDSAGSQLSAFLSPGKILGAAKGLGVGLWVVAEGVVEPMLRYRRPWFGFGLHVTMAVGGE